MAKANQTIARISAIVHASDANFSSIAPIDNRITRLKNHLDDLKKIRATSPATKDEKDRAIEHVKNDMLKLENQINTQTKNSKNRRQAAYA